MYGVTEMTTLFIFCYQELMGIGCNGTWQESDPDACLQVTAMFTAGGPDVEIHRNSAEMILLKNVTTDRFLCI